MRAMAAFGLIVGIWCAAEVAWGQQNQPWGGDQGYDQPQQRQVADYPDQPVQPQSPTLQRRNPAGDYRGPYLQPGEAEQPSQDPRSYPAQGRMQPGEAQGAGAGMNAVAQAAPQQPPPPPFQLSAVEEAALDRTLTVWQDSSAKVNRFNCKFVQFKYDKEFGDPKKNFLVSQEQGELRYEAPDKGYFDISGQRPERWVCDGKSVYQYNFQAKVITEHKLPPELQGKGIANGPLPFLFGAKRDDLKRRYWMRTITPQGARQQVWLEAYPRFLDDARNFSVAHVILTLTNNEILPAAVQLYAPNGKNWTVFKLENPIVNQSRLFQADVFTARKPGWDWQIEVAQDPGVVPQDRRRPAGGMPSTMGSRPMNPR